MALRNEIQQILEDELEKYPMAQVFLERGEQGVIDEIMEGDPGTAQLEFAKLQSAITEGLRVALFRLADEIDRLKADSE